jgi:hypothetical protein
LTGSCSVTKHAGRTSVAYLKQDIIASSQGGASPLFFEVEDTTAILFSSAFNNRQELVTRNGIPIFISKIQKKKPVTVAFIVGSVTQMENKYRNQTARFIKGMFPGSLIRFINAGVSGTGTDLGACRIADQVLRYRPDLIFIDFAVNGSGLPGLEGMIRKIIKNAASTDICLYMRSAPGRTSYMLLKRYPLILRDLKQCRLL